MVAVFTICAGITSGRMSLEGEIEIALYFILLAVFLDAVDGKLARYLDAAGPFGAELDTLARFFQLRNCTGHITVQYVVPRDAPRKCRMDGDSYSRGLLCPTACPLQPLQ